MTWRLIHADCLEAMAAMDPASVDAVVCDPPYGLEFMGKEWDRLGPHWNRIGAGTDGWEAGTRTDGRTAAKFATASPRYDPQKQGGAVMQTWHAAWATEALRVLKPGAHLLAFGGTRTYHRLACALEDAGFEIRDCLAWLYGSGFPKSLDVSKAIDARHLTGKSHSRAVRQANDTREVIGSKMGQPGTSLGQEPSGAMWGEPGAVAQGKDVENMKARQGGAASEGGHRRDLNITAPATPEAERWQGWGTALKPAFEPIVLARKPLVGSVAQNVTAHGTGALNIDGTRIEGVPPSVPQPEFGVRADGVTDFGAGEGRNGEMSTAPGRWPANVVLGHSPDCNVGEGRVGNHGEQGSGSQRRDHTVDPWTQDRGPSPTSGCAPDCAAAMLDAQTGELHSQDPRTRLHAEARGPLGVTGFMRATDTAYADHGGASRFFYCPKADREERDRGLEGFAVKPVQEYGSIRSERGNGYPDATEMRNPHPTVKPVELMRWLVRLVTPPGGTVLDPFTGSGSTGIAALREGFDFIGIEREADYVEIARARIQGDAPLFNIPAEVV